MILQCPSCNARFMVADALIPAEGRTVRCGRCTHQWFTLRDPAADVTQPADFAVLAEQAYNETPPVADPSKLPVVQKKRRAFSLRPFKIAVPLLAATWLVLAVFAYFPNGQYSPVLRGLYSMLGVTDTRGLVFTDITMQREDAGPMAADDDQTADTRTTFIVAGSIANHDEQARLVPMVRVAILDPDGKKLWQRSYAVNQVVEPGQVYPFRIEDIKTSFAKSASSIVLDLGNRFEMMMR